MPSRKPGPTPLSKEDRDELLRRIEQARADVPARPPRSTRSAGDVFGLNPLLDTVERITGPARDIARMADRVLGRAPAAEVPEDARDQAAAVLDQALAVFNRFLDDLERWVWVRAPRAYSRKRLTKADWGKLLQEVRDEKKKGKGSADAMRAVAKRHGVKFSSLHTRFYSRKRKR
jgi:hypothetical protein